MCSKGLQKAKSIFKIVISVMLLLVSFVICAVNAKFRRTDSGGDGRAVKPPIVAE